MTRSFVSVLVLAGAVSIAATGPSSSPDAALLERARALHRQVPLIDGHNDYPWALREKSPGRDLDVLPAGVDKGTAAVFLAKHWGVPRERVIVCGDTANDLSMFEQGFCGIVVGNALPELRALRSPRVYHARGRFAAGVEEGLRYWFERSFTATS